jgi:hypothetical protein
VQVEISPGPLSPTELDLGMPMDWHVMSGGVIQKKKTKGDEES